MLRHRGIVERLPALRLIVTTGVQNDAIDLGSCRDRRVVVVGTRSRRAPVVELA